MSRHPPQTTFGDDYCLKRLIDICSKQRVARASYLSWFILLKYTHYWPATSHIYLWQDRLTSCCACGCPVILVFFCSYSWVFGPLKEEKTEANSLWIKCVIIVISPYFIPDQAQNPCTICCCVTVFALFHKNPLTLGRGNYYCSKNIFLNLIFNHSFKESAFHSVLHL